jgi:predicted acylesterase/phospholipase RssA
VSAESWWWAVGNIKCDASRAMEERRLAITIKGGVSLGAYEAGVLTEIMHLLEYNNRHVADGNSAGVPWYIDTLAGASAGSITAHMISIKAGPTPTGPGKKSVIVRKRNLF